MAQPHLPDLLIEGYRGLRRLELKKLGNVNLIVGRNGVGKTSVLEAVRLYATVASAECLTELLRLRGEIEYVEKSPPQFELSAISSMFLGAEDPQRTSSVIKIGPQTQQMEFSIAWVPTVLDSLGNRVLHFDASKPRTYTNDSEAALLVEEAGAVRRLLTLKRVPVLGSESNKRVPPFIEHPPLFVTSQGIDYENFGDYWDHVVDNLQEDLVLETLQRVWPEVQQIRLFGSARRPKIKLRSAEGFVPISRLGDGILRFLGITIGLVNSRNGFLLIDEFENGLHYTTQETLWKFVIRAARDLNVQVFATTHSRDCTASFGRATAGDAESLGVLTKLEKVGDSVVAKQLEEEDVVLATENLVEIR